MRLHAPDLLAAYELRAKRRLSQNFLTDRRVIDRIVDAARALAPKSLVEIGPGLGALTGPLSELGVPLIAIDKDRELAAILREALRDQSHVDVREGDILEAPLGALAPGSVVVGNLPYNLSTPILLHLVEHRAQLGTSIVMVQKEFGDRLVAPPGSKTYGSLSALFRLLANMRVLLDVPPGAFVPAPSVWSVVIQIEWLAQPRYDVPSVAAFERVARAAFAQRRKMLRNTLGVAFGKELSDAALQGCAIDATRRAETLSCEEFARLARALA